MALTLKEKNELAKQYEPLVNKLTKQYTESIRTNWEDIKSYAYEGLAIAMNTYNPDKSKMTFTQFAAFSIRNNILTSVNNELRTVKLNAYAQKKALEHGEAVFNTVSIDTNVNSEDNTGITSAKYWSVLSESAKFSDGDIFDTLYSKLEDKFSQRDCDIFYMTFGLKDYDVIKGKDIAKIYNISRSSVSIKINSIICYIRKDNELVEILANLIN